MRLEPRSVHADLGPDPVAAAVSGLLPGDGHLSFADRQMMAWTEGLLTAAAIGPERTHPAEWANGVFGPDSKYENAEQAQACLAVLTLMHDKVLADLRSMRQDYEPFFLEHAKDGEEIELGTQWAEGFIEGMRLRGHAWRKMIGSEQGKRSLGSIVVFLPEVVVAENSEDDIAAARREALQSLGPSIYEISQYWKARSGRVEPAAVSPFRKIGRNEPCPCGSGRKHKKCCLGLAEQDD
jgi:uncharacterized protein